MQSLGTAGPATIFAHRPGADELGWPRGRSWGSSTITGGGRGVTHREAEHTYIWGLSLGLLSTNPISAFGCGRPSKDPPGSSRSVLGLDPYVAVPAVIFALGLVPGARRLGRALRQSGSRPSTSASARKAGARAGIFRIRARGASILWRWLSRDPQPCTAALCRGSRLEARPTQDDTLGPPGPMGALRPTRCVT